MANSPRKSPTLLGAAALTAVLAACGGAGNATTGPAATSSGTAAATTAASVDTSDCKSVTLKAGQNSSEEHPYQAGLKAWADAVSKGTAGRVTVTIYPNSELGDEPAMVEGLKLGTVDAVVAATPTLTAFSPKMGLWDLPFLAKDLAQNYRQIDGEVGEQLAQEVAPSTGGTTIGWFYAGQRNVWNKVRPINTPDDFKGLKIRTQTSNVQVATFNAFGALGTPMAFAELYQALQTGVVDGADNDPVDVLTEKFYEVTKYYSFTGHRYINAALMVSTSSLDSLCAADKAAVIAAGADAEVAERKAEEDLTGVAIDQLKEKGIVFNDVADKAPFQKLAQSVYDQFKSEIGEDLIQKTLAQ